MRVRSTRQRMHSARQRMRSPCHTHVFFEVISFLELRVWHEHGHGHGHGHGHVHGHGHGHGHVHVHVHVHLSRAPKATRSELDLSRAGIRSSTGWDPSACVDGMWDGSGWRTAPMTNLCSGSSATGTMKPAETRRRRYTPWMGSVAYTP